MKKIIFMLFIIAIIANLAMAQTWSNKEISATHEKHRNLLTKFACNFEKSDSKFEMRMLERRTFSIFSKDAEASVCTSEADRDYMVYAKKEGSPSNFTITFSIHVSGGEKQYPIISGTVKKEPKSFEVALSTETVEAGYSSEYFVPFAVSMLQHSCCYENWWEGMLAFDPTITDSRETYYATRDQAVANVPTHVSPKYCFVWNDGPSATPWRPIPGTGCAHWVAHQKGIQSSPGCYDRYAIRVSQVVSGKRQYSISQAEVGDIWTNTDLSHCGIVIGVGSGYVQVRHCSSGSGGVVVSNFTSGYAYR